MNETVQHRQPFSIERAIEQLHIKRKEILSLSAEKALDAILDHPQPHALIHSFPEQDFYFLIHDIGIEDSLELLSLASNRQWEYILDVEIWQRDTMIIPLVTKWLHILLKADPERLINWFLDEKTEFIEFYLLKNMEVGIREHDQDPSDFGDGFFTFDDMFYIKFFDDPFDSEFKIGEQRDAFLSEFLNRLAAYDFMTYQKVMFEFQVVIPAETEEEAYRLRNVRLAEKGFMPFDEAIGIYQPLKPSHLKRQTKKLMTRDDDRNFPAPLYPAEMLKQDNLFTRSLQTIETGGIFEQLQAEFAGLCNQVISADQKTIREKDELRHIVKKVCGYISIGLERLAKDENENPHRINQSAVMIQKFPLSRIFRAGYGLALELKWRAEKWRKNSWFEKKGLPLSFWGEEWLGVIGGLLIKKPLFFDNYKTGVIYREFASLDDINETESTLSEVIAFDELLCLMFDVRCSMSDVRCLMSNVLLTHKNFILTFWARHYLGLPEALLPIEIDEFKRFFSDLWSGKEKPRKTSRLMKEFFLSWLSDKTGADAYEIIGNSGKTLKNLFEEIESEYGEVSEKDLDPKYIYLFLVKNVQQ